MQHTYTYTVPLFVNLLTNLRNVLDKAAAHAQEAGISEVAMLSDSLAPDMFPLKKQVQVACDNAKGAVARLTGRENPVMEDTEATFTELQARIDKTLAFIQGVSEADFEGSEDRKIVLPYFPGKYLLGGEYVSNYVIPNFVFHITTAYGIVRKNGVQIGKGDFITNLPFKDLEQKPE